MTRLTRAMTLVEMLIVVLIIGILLLIAIPQWRKVRASSQTQVCRGNLYHMDNAKEQVALAKKMSTGEIVNETDIFPEYLKGATFPECPTAGVYSIGVVGEPCTCSIHGHR